MSQIQELQQAIARLPRVELGVRPTPLDELRRLRQSLDGPPIYMKRDDLTGLALGGNKTRMLEFSIAHALDQGADTIVSGMAVQSNYCRQLAAACAKTGLSLHLVLRPVRAVDREQVQGNHLLQRIFGAQIDVLPDNDRAAQAAAVEAKAAELRRAGHRVYLPRRPDTVDLDAIAYAECAAEIVEQCSARGITPRYLYTAAADTTQAGLVLGFKLLGSSINVRGINPMQGSEDRQETMAEMARNAAQRLGLAVEVGAGDFDNDRSYVGERYGVPTPAGLAAIRLLAQQEGILLDPVYTGKAMGALIDHIRTGQLDHDEPVLFLHTGGAPALFGYADALLQEDKTL